MDKPRLVGVRARLARLKVFLPRQSCAKNRLELLPGRKPKLANIAISLLY